MYIAIQIQPSILSNEHAHAWYIQQGMYVWAHPQSGLHCVPLVRHRPWPPQQTCAVPDLCQHMPHGSQSEDLKHGYQ